MRLASSVDGIWDTARTHLSPDVFSRGRQGREIWQPNSPVAGPTLDVEAASCSRRDDREAVAGLSLLSTLGMITADANAFLVPVPRPLLLRIARFLDTAATSVREGANLPEGLEQSRREDFTDILHRDADGIRVIANADDGEIPGLWRTPDPH